MLDEPGIRFFNVALLRLEMLEVVVQAEEVHYLVFGNVVQRRADRFCEYLLQLDFGLRYECELDVDAALELWQVLQVALQYLVPAVAGILAKICPGRISTGCIVHLLTNQSARCLVMWKYILEVKLVFHDCLHCFMLPPHRAAADKVGRRVQIRVGLFVVAHVVLGCSEVVVDGRLYKAQAPRILRSKGCGRKEREKLLQVNFGQKKVLSVMLDNLGAGCVHDYQEELWIMHGRGRELAPLVKGKVVGAIPEG